MEQIKEWNWGKITFGLAAIGLSAYILIQGNGKQYVMEKLRQRGNKIRLEQKCAQIKKKI